MSVVHSGQMPARYVSRKILTIATLLSFFACSAISQGVETRDSPASDKEALRDLAAHLLEDAPRVGCLPQECKILVLNFATPADVNSLYGIRLADNLSKQLADLQKDVQVFDRSLLKTYVRVANLASDSPKTEKDIREFARGLGASAAVAGVVEKSQDGSLRLTVRLLASKENGPAGPSREAVVPPMPTDLTKEVPESSSIPPQAASTPYTGPLGDGKTAIAGKNGVPLPVCSYMPNPPYTKEARAAKFSGSVLVEGIVGVDGKVTHVRVLRSPGLGLDDQVIKTLKTWRCQPAIGPKGNPVPVIVPFQINFRSY